jgi:hypothetical protein
MGELPIDVCLHATRPPPSHGPPRHSACARRAATRAGSAARVWPRERACAQWEVPCEGCKGATCTVAARRRGVSKPAASATHSDPPRPLSNAPPPPIQILVLAGTTRHASSTSSAVMRTGPPGLHACRASWVVVFPHVPFLGRLAGDASFELANFPSDSSSLGRLTLLEPRTGRRCTTHSVRHDTARDAVGTLLDVIHAI